VAARGTLGVYPVTSPPSALKGGGDVGSVPVEVCRARPSSAAAKCPGNVLPRRWARRRIPSAAFGLKKYLDRSGRVSKTSDNEDAAASLGDSEELSVQHSVGEPMPALAHCPEDGTHCAPVGFHAAPRARAALDAVRDAGDENSAGSDGWEAGACVLAEGAETAGVVDIPLVAANWAAISFGLVGGTGNPLGTPFSASVSATVSHAGSVTGTRADGRQETGDVLKKEPPWAQLVGQPHDLPEQPRACAAQARAAACHREVLTREAAAENSSFRNKSGCS
jgi:hypothetical protein